MCCLSRNYPSDGDSQLRDLQHSPCGLLLTPQRCIHDISPVVEESPTGTWQIFGIANEAATGMPKQKP